MPPTRILALTLTLALTLILTLTFNPNQGMHKDSEPDHSPLSRRRLGLE